MNYYELNVSFNKRGDGFMVIDEMVPFATGDEKNEKRFYRELCREINEKFDMDTDRKTNAYAYYAEEGIVKFIFEADQDELKKCTVRKKITEICKDRYGQVEASVSKAKEITCEVYYKLGHHAERKGYIDDFDDREIDIFRSDRHPYIMKEELIPEKDYTRKKLTDKAEEYLADDSFLSEIDRIYSGENEKNYYGNPVHYMLSVTSRDSIGNMITLLGSALHANKRILGRRITRFSEIGENCYREDEFEQMIARSGGNITVIELDGSCEDHGNYAHAYHEVIEYIDKLFRKYQSKTLFVFVKNLEHPGFADILLSKITDKARVVEIKEGGGDAKSILQYIKKVAEKDEQPLDEAEIKKALGNKKYFKVGEAHEIYNRCFSNALMYSAYKAYKTCTYLKPDDKKKESKPYDELQKMIGLTEVKKIVDSIINNARIQKIRSDNGMDSFKTSLHMVFTGNPGSAKTTVARLLAQILAKEDIIDKAEVVECGRSDLVGKYVGWTAKEVKTKFRQAKGGILFIDEAYSLLEHWEGSYGDEAINTIVQEMENHRDDVIVIFAGYPEKMKDFLDRNEGLRSRIAFHIDFPDYEPGELMRILKLMADEKGFCLGTGVEEKCMEVFNRTAKQKDYGNGRFVRNLLEQAMLAQSNRLASGYKNKKISRRALISLKPEDFEVNASKQYSDQKMKIGFIGSP
ncbi:MAG: AAA family ATPase [Lachnospiraceae bacterium]|nr:AAA family ATPase [Lachnospiraceae bacterium]